MNAKAFLVEGSEGHPGVAAKGPGLVRRYEYPPAGANGTFAAFAASLLAELDAVPEVDFERVTRVDGRVKAGQ